MTPNGHAKTAAIGTVLLTLFGAVANSFGGSTAAPAIPGFERFHSATDINPTAGGRLLIGELNCTACHVADPSLAAWIRAKPAPILDSVGSRVRPEFLRRFLADPHTVDPGTTMPDLFAGIDRAQRNEQVEALVHFLVSDGTLKELRSDPAAGRRGERLYHEIGCAVCHGERRKGATLLPTSVPLPDLGQKYTIGSLAEFLRDPHVVRPGGRMPNFDLDEKQSLDIAHYLIPDANPQPKNPRVTYRVYQGSFNKLPDFAMLKPSAKGQADDFDIYVAGEEQNYAIVFEGFLKIERDGEYWFRIGSDDGSRLYIDDELVADHDGVHAYSSVRGAKTLKAGVHRVRVEYAQVGGDQKLSIVFEGPGIEAQRLANITYLTAEAKPIKLKPTGAKDRPAPFQLDKKLAEKGSAFFAKLGCANCHQKKMGDKPLASSFKATPISELRLEHGCLAASPSSTGVNYSLTARQRESIAAALVDRPKESPSDAERIDETLTAFNCYACHERAGKGGVEPERNHLFVTSVPEMGDEGRIPPHLTGVGDKLRVEWLRHLLGNGASDRTYMRTRMPSFGSENVGFLADAFAALDRRDEVTIPAIDLPKHRIESVGRQLVGESALSCIKCHNVGNHAGTGIQAINLQTMTRRLRQDWFVRYMPDPQQYRPGTRMPSAFPNGKSVVRDVLGGDAGQQLAAIWTYLELGEKAPIPAGAVTSAIVLTPSERPIVYRGFLEGLSPRGIAVGYPEKAHIAFDAEQMCLALIWHNEFLDASQHWAGRGAGTIRPMGDHALSQVRGVPLAVLPSNETAWPSNSASAQGWQFRGYRLDAKGRPLFRYESDLWSVEDKFEPIAAESAATPDAVLHRILAISPKDGASLPERLFFRAAEGKTIESVGGRNFVVDGALTLRFAPDADSPTPIVRDSAGHKELLIGIAPGSRGTIEIDYEW